MTQLVSLFIERLRSRPLRERKLIGLSAYAAGSAIVISLWVASLGGAVKNSGAPLPAATAAPEAISALKSPLEALGAAMKDTAGALSEYAGELRSASEKQAGESRGNDSSVPPQTPSNSPSAMPARAAAAKPAEPDQNLAGRPEAIADGKSAPPLERNPATATRLASLVGAAPRPDDGAAEETASLLSKELPLQHNALARYADRIQNYGERLMRAFLDAGARIIALGQELGFVLKDLFFQLKDVVRS